MPDPAHLTSACRELMDRLDGPPQIDRLKAVYLELSFLTGQLQGAVNDTARAQGETREVQFARASFESFKSSLRRVGFDIRLASPAALQMGLQASLEHALEALDHLEPAIG